MKVLIIPEDPILDQYILKPVLERMFSDLGASPRIQILTRPRTRGVAQALNRAVLAEIVDTYRMVDLFVVMVDRDGVESRNTAASDCEQEHSDRLFVCLAVEEVEVWMLAAHRHLLDESWSTIRAERDPKERFAEPFLKRHAPRGAAGRGRAWAMRALGPNWRGVVSVCPELAAVREKIGNYLS